MTAELPCNKVVRLFIFLKRRGFLSICSPRKGADIFIESLQHTWQQILHAPQRKLLSNPLLHLVQRGHNRQFLFPGMMAAMIIKTIYSFKKR
jgi:hypothetical protein